jgi:hypothetical protein
MSAANATHIDTSGDDNDPRWTLHESDSEETQLAYLDHCDYLREAEERVNELGVLDKANPQVRSQLAELLTRQRNGNSPPQPAPVIRLASAEEDEALIAELEAMGTPPIDTWLERDLVDAGNMIPKPASIARLFYPLERHTMFGPHSAGKTQLCAGTVATVVKEGRNVAWVDVDGGNPGDLLERLRSFGLSDEQIREHVDYYTPDEMLSTQQRERLKKRCIDRQTQLTIIDSAIGSMTRQELEPKDANAVEKWWIDVGDCFKGIDGAVNLIDHTGHAHDAMGRPMDSARKLQAVACAFALAAVTPGGRGDLNGRNPAIGKTKITIAKDRPTFHGPRDSVLGILNVISAQVEPANTETGSPGLWELSWEIEAPIRQEPGTWRPTAIMEQINRWLESNPGEHSANIVETQAARGSGDVKFRRQAINELVIAGYVKETQGARNSRLFSYLKPYRQEDDPLIHHEKQAQLDGLRRGNPTRNLDATSLEDQESLERLNRAGNRPYRADLD